MVKYRLKANPQGQFYFPKEVREELGHELILIPNSRAGVIFPKDATFDEVLESLRVIIEDLKLRKKLEESKK